MIEVEESCVTGLIRSRVHRDQSSGCVLVGGAEMAFQLAKRAKAFSFLRHI